MRFLWRYTLYYHYIYLNRSLSFVTWALKSDEWKMSAGGGWNVEQRSVLIHLIAGF